MRISDWSSDVCFSDLAESRVATGAARAKAVVAAEKVTTLRETEVAERLAAIDRLLAAKNADTAKTAAEADRITADAAAEAQRLRNEAENVLGAAARAPPLRATLHNSRESTARGSGKEKSGQSK